ncbi:unnamed protein product [Trichobilharzia regenti]|nr:unnamed protein product [Trichobilharzia regenti]
MLHKNPPVVLNDPLLDPDSKSSCSPSSLLSSSSISTYESFNSTEKHASIISESKITDRLTGDTVKETAPPPPPTAASSNPVESSTPSSSANQEIRSVAGKLFTALLNLLPLEVCVFGFFIVIIIIIITGFTSSYRLLSIL